MSGSRRLGSRPAASAAERSEAYYRKVADQLIEQIERGTARWTQAWQPGEKAMPCNVATGKAYRGGNSVWLASVADQRGYQDERWGTFKQVKGLGGQVRRGENGSAILFWQFETRKLARDRNGRPVQDEEGKPVYETVPLERPRSYPYTVFNGRAVQRAAEARTAGGSARLELDRGGGEGPEGVRRDDRERRQEPGLLRPAPRPHHPAVQGAVPERAGLLPDGPARAGALDGAPGPAQPGDPDARDGRGLRLAPLRARGTAGGDQLDDDRGPAPNRSRPVAARRLRGLLDPGAQGRSAGDLPGLAGRAGDDRLRAGPGAGKRAAAQHGASCGPGAGGGPG